MLKLYEERLPPHGHPTDSRQILSSLTRFNSIDGEILLSFCLQDSKLLEISTKLRLFLSKLEELLNLTNENNIPPTQVRGIKRKRFV